MQLRSSTRYSNGQRRSIMRRWDRHRLDGERRVDSEDCAAVGKAAVSIGGDGFDAGHDRLQYTASFVISRRRTSSTPSPPVDTAVFLIVTVFAAIDPLRSRSTQIRYHRLRGRRRTPSTPVDTAASSRWTCYMLAMMRMRK